MLMFLSLLMRSADTHTAVRALPGVTGKVKNITPGVDVHGCSPW